MAIHECRMRQTIALIVAVAAVASPATQRSQPSFDVASVRENTSGADRYSFSSGLTKNGLGQDVAGVGIAVITNAPLREVIARAYGIDIGMEAHTLFGEQPLLEKRFDITAQPPADVSGPEAPGARAAMLRSLLADRFSLKIHTESRRMPTFVLVRARQDRLGPGLRASSYDCVEHQRLSPKAPELRDANGEPLCQLASGTNALGMNVIRYAAPIDVLIRRFQRSFSLPLIDETGLDGSFEWTLMVGGDKERGTYLSLTDALEQQLGLKVERRVVSRDVLVIDSVEMPTPN